jgi:Ca2+/H+ antiporter
MESCGKRECAVGMYGAIRSYRRYVSTIRSSHRSFVPCFTLLIYLNSTEILVDVVDVVLNGSGIDEKFLGVTLFALVPNTTEFMNAMSFAMNGNIALRYVLTVF